MMISTFRWFASALLVLAVLASPTPALAQSGAAPSAAGQPAANPKTPKEFVTRATQEFVSGNYDQAVEDYQAAYQLRSLATLLFNIAQAHRKAGHWAEALAYYERFLKDDPKSALAPEAEAHSTAMRAKLDAEKLSTEREALERLAKQRADEAEALAKAREEERKKAEAALLLATAQKDKKPVYKKAWFWVVIGGVVVAGAVGLGVGLALRPKDPSSDLGLRVVQF